MALIASNDLGTNRRRLAAYLDTLFVDHGIFRVVWTSRFKLDPRMARSNQPLPFQIAQEARRGTRTIVNLRGARVCGSYALEEEACARHGIHLVNFPVSSRDVPARETFRAARDIFRAIDYPALMHCKSGADRAGLMSVLYLVFERGAPVAEALSQLSWRFGHVRQAKTGILDFVFERYLADTREAPQDLLSWAETRYDPAAVKAAFMSQWWANVFVDRVLRRE